MPEAPLVNENLLWGSYRFYSSPLQYLDDHFKNYGDPIRFKIPGRTFVSSRAPDFFEHVLVKNQKSYSKSFSSEQLGLALGKGLLTNSGDSWLHQRRLIQPAFYKKRTENLFETIESITDEFLEKMVSAKSGASYFIDQEMMTLTSIIVLETLLGVKMNEDLEKIKTNISRLQTYLVNRIRIPYYKDLAAWNGAHHQFEQQLSEIDNILYKIIEQKKSLQSEQSNIITMLLQAEDQDTGEKMSDKQLRDELITFYVAGHETSAYALSWTIYELLRHPEWLQKVKEEAKAIIKDGKIGIAGYKELKITTAVIQEAMRLHPPAHFVTRTCIKDDNINNIDLKKGDNIIFSIIGMHKNPAIWEQPDAFLPERFLNNIEATRKYFHPFGAGPRMCIGNHFAMMEITIILAKFVEKLNVRLAPFQKIEPEALVTLKPKNGIKIIKA